MIFLRAVCCFGICCSAGIAHAVDAFFRDHVATILERRCIHCHGGSNPKGGLSLVSAAKLMVGGENGRVVVARHPEESLLLDYISGDSPEMPKGEKPPTADEVAAI